MSFHEKSAWVMSVALLLGAVCYFSAVRVLSEASGLLISPNAPFVVVYTVLLVLVAIVGHIVIAIMAPKEASNPPDEREKRIIERSGNCSGVVFAGGVILSLGSYLVTYNGDLLFYGTFGSLMIGQLAEYVVQIFYFRVGL